MTAVAMPAPAVLEPIPPAGAGGGDEPPTPAPVGTILAVMARIASHAGDPLSVTVTEPVHVITVNVADQRSYTAWRLVIRAGGVCVLGDDLGTLSMSYADLHGWQLVVQIAGPA